MSDTDPFGREKSEDPLAEMGWSAPTASTQATPSTVAPPERPDHAAQRQPTGTVTVGGIPGQGRKSRGGCFVVVVILVFIGGIGAAVIPAIIDAIDTVGEQIDDITPTIPDIADDGPGGGGGGGGDKQGPPPAGLSRT